MADISKCANKDCKLKELCYRFTAPDNEFYQSYSDFKPNKTGTKCKYFMKIIEKK
jgi:hypothetical protein